MCIQLELYAFNSINVKNILPHITLKTPLFRYPYTKICQEQKNFQNPGKHLRCSFFENS